ncbi:MAG: type II toxin-antitoxin system PemK/MazF family toxin [Eggerthellaceae bacterium]|nr:type II toxin-antitoxin system PemK/MazF family toxin [Eggerthellaceae bacterium]
MWLAYVEFSDHPGVGKVRPVVVIDVVDDTCIVVAAKVTSKDLRQDSSGSVVPIIDWDECGLRKPSYIRIDQKLELSFESLLRDEPIGKLPDSYMGVIVRAISSIGS